MVEIGEMVGVKGGSEVDRSGEVNKSSPFLPKVVG